METGGKYEWDEAKRQENLDKHGVDFLHVTGLDWDAALTFDQPHGDELRHQTFAPLANRLHALIWTARGDRCRVISFRKANNREIKTYEETT